MTWFFPTGKDGSGTDSKSPQTIEQLVREQEETHFLPRELEIGVALRAAEAKRQARRMRAAGMSVENKPATPSLEFK